MSVDRLCRRRLCLGLATACATLAASVGGCSTRDEPQNGEDDEPHPALLINGRALRSSFPFRLVDPETDERLVEVHWHEEHAHWHFAPLELTREVRRTVRAQFVDTDGQVVPIGGDAPYGLEAHPEDDPTAGILEIDVDDDLVHLYGTAVATGQIRFRLRRDGDVAWAAPPLDVEIREPADAVETTSGRTSTPPTAASAQR